MTYPSGRAIAVFDGTNRFAQIVVAVLAAGSGVAVAVGDVSQVWLVPCLLMAAPGLSARWSRRASVFVERVGTVLVIPFVTLGTAAMVSLVIVLLNRDAGTTGPADAAGLFLSLALSEPAVPLATMGVVAAFGGVAYGAYRVVGWQPLNRLLAVVLTSGWFLLLVLIFVAVYSLWLYLPLDLRASLGGV